MALKKLTNQIWTVDFEMPIGPGVHFPVRTLIYRDFKSKVMIISPGPLKDSEYDEIRELGTVCAIVAPNLFHHMFVTPALEAFPEAGFYRAHELILKRPDLEGKGRSIMDLAIANFADFEFKTVRGIPRLQETVFFFPNDHLLFVSDLLHHIVKPHGWGTKLILSLAGTNGKLALSRITSLLMKDRESARQDLQKILEWEFDRILVAHGEPIMENAKTRVEPIWNSI